MTIMATEREEGKLAAGKAKKKNYLQKVLVSLVIVFGVVFPSDVYNIRDALFGLALVFCFPKICKGVLKSSTLGFYALLFPIVLFLYSAMLGNNVSEIISYDYIWLYLLLLPAIQEYDINVKRPFLIATLFVAFITLFICITDILGIWTIYDNPLSVFFLKQNEINVTKGPYNIFKYGIFFKTSPLMIFTYCYCLHKKKYVTSLFFLLALCISGTRANFIVAILAAVLIPISSRDISLKKIGYISTLFLGGMLSIPIIIEKYLSASARRYGISDSRKIEHLDSLFIHMNQHPFSYIFGTGIGSYFYTSALDMETKLIELSYFDYFRQVGVIGFAIFLLFLLKPFKAYYKTDLWVVIAYSGYLLVAATNPLLVSSTAFMGYLVIFSGSLCKTKKSII